MKTKLLDEAVKKAIQTNTPLLHPQYYNFIHFSFLIQKNKILQMGVNRVGQPFYKFGYAKNYKRKIHSEVDVLRNGRYWLEKNKLFEIINIRLNKKHELRLSKPCNCCLALLEYMGCQRVYYSTNTNFERLDLI